MLKYSSLSDVFRYTLFGPNRGARKSAPSTAAMQLFCVAGTLWGAAACFADDSPPPFAYGVFDVINSTGDRKQAYRFDSDKLGGLAIQWLNRTSKVRVAGVVGFERRSDTSPHSLQINVRMLAYYIGGSSPLTASKTWIGVTIKDLKGNDATSKFHIDNREIRKNVHRESDQHKLRGYTLIDDYENQSLLRTRITPKNSSLPFVGEKTPPGEYVAVIYLAAKSLLPPFSMPTKAANFFPFAGYRFRVGANRNAALYTYDTRISETRRRAVSDRAESDRGLIFDETFRFSKDKTWVYFNANTGSARAVKGFIKPSRQPSPGDTHVLHIFYTGMREFAGCEILFQPRRKGRDYKPDYDHILAHFHADPKHAKYPREFFGMHDKADRVYIVTTPGGIYTQTIGKLRAVVTVVAVKTTAMVEEGYGRLTGFAELKLRVKVYKMR